ncbi:hypothetical protein [Bradyrhizobium sp. CCBAU 53415]|nr:hypothetical protein [Bradyrhizobium sp. CCBAU 53415]
MLHVVTGYAQSIFGLMQGVASGWKVAHNNAPDNSAPPRDK